MVGRSSRRSGSGWKALPEVWEWSGGTLEGLRVVGKPSRRSGSGREALPMVREWSADPSSGPGEAGRLSRWSGNVRRPSQSSGSDWEAFLEV